MPQLRVILVCHRCARLELRYVRLSAPADPRTVSFPLPEGWHQRWDDDGQAIVVECDRCASAS
ncbi:MAG TPA: hypothetical protein VE987_06065 [Polyangiaceae bacterium]|nr:hypothetical protein [Polyangiaceae bacterium]